MFMYRYGRWACAPGYESACGSSRAARRSAADRFGAAAMMHTGRMFGVRRPLRYLTWKLGLDDQQVRELADLLNRLKTSRAQTRVDWERSVADIADLFTSENFDSEKAQVAVDRRRQSAEAHQHQVLDALRQLHEILDDEQRAELAYLLSSGALDI